MDDPAFTNDSIGAILLYKCQPNYYINYTYMLVPTNTSSGSLTQFVSVPIFPLKKTMELTCSQDGNWTKQYPDADIRCYHPCMIKLPTLVNAWSDFNSSKNYSDANNQTLSVECLPGYEFAFNKTKQVLTCAASKWDDRKLLPCYKVCLDPIREAGEEMTVANVTANSVNTTMTYACTEGHHLNTTEV
ncbi:uncharacterized protein LOC108674727 [Hyalella azteca]|uniref:Uncharacterized protein LOC108674727 n=1 Tax=Hyalella azteca TaxID=294128 RepID=A0A8B7NWP5_HYAAZ|nr:uncharacterized protein LOC108674727 [Hyalella azteca]